MDEPTSDNNNETLREYFSAYRRKMYKEQPDKIKDKNKAYYYKYKFNCSSEEMKRYDVLLPNVLRIKQDLDILREKNPDIINEILSPYLSNH